MFSGHLERNFLKSQMIGIALSWKKDKLSFDETLLGVCLLIVMKVHLC